MVTIGPAGLHAVMLTILCQEVLRAQVDVQVQCVFDVEFERLGWPKGTQLESALDNCEVELQAQLALLAALESSLEQIRLQDQLAAADQEFATCLAMSRVTYAHGQVNNLLMSFYLQEMSHTAAPNMLCTLNVGCYERQAERRQMGVQAISSRSSMIESLWVVYPTQNLHGKTCRRYGLGEK